MVLNNMKIGQSARIVGYSNEDSSYFIRLLDLGLTRGACFTLKKVAPLGDPVEIELRGFNLSLRKNEASLLKLELVANCTENSAK
jgi:ferrous iron transport protein A